MFFQLRKILQLYVFNEDVKLGLLLGS